MEFINRFLHGDCEKVLQQLPDNCIDLIFTSPPYADQRKKTYGGVGPDEYVDWFLPKAGQFMRVLKPAGTFILNIKERVVGGERHTYVLELIMKMREQGWLWTEEFMWHKKNSYPGKWPNRFRDNWERLIQFNKDKKFHMHQEAVMVPVGDWAKDRLTNLSETDKSRDESKVGSGFGKNVSNWLGRSMVYPTNVIHLATECSNRNHSAAFPVELPAWFIKLFTKSGDVVLDPFMGSGTTALAAIQHGRNFVGIDISKEYIELAKKRTADQQIRLPNIAERRASYPTAKSRSKNGAKAKSSLRCLDQVRPQLGQQFTADQT
ncbi:MAG: site-specific DNA-methyltransferase [Chloroflexi bacterium]|nr:site-specific DNA-methyltransferase [Chloroflexota bacterium]